MKAREHPRAVLAITGLKLEADIAEGDGVVALAGAHVSQKLRDTLLTPATQPCAIISFGIAGGLNSRYGPGTVIIGREVVHGAKRWATDVRWAGAMAARIPGSIEADIACSDSPLMDPKSKAQLRRESGAVAVDTESHVAADAAASHNLPFAVFRVIADPADRALPEAARVAVRADGCIDTLRAVKAVSRWPAEIPLLLRTAVDARAALRALASGRKRLGAGLGYPDFGKLLLDVA